MSFHEMRFPANLSFGAIGGPERRTDVVTLANGFEERNTPWAHSRRRYDAGMGLRSLDDLEELIAFYEARRGRLHGFRWKDWSDYKSCKPSDETSALDQLIFIGDGSTFETPLTKAYASGNQTYLRPICKPVIGTVGVAVDGVVLQESVDFDVDYTSGLITLSSPPAAGVEVRAGYEFDVPVRFDSDSIQTSIASFQAGQAPNVPVMELRI